MPITSALLCKGVRCIAASHTAPMVRKPVRPASAHAHMAHLLNPFALEPVRVNSDVQQPSCVGVSPALQLEQAQPDAVLAATVEAVVLAGYLHAQSGMRVAKGHHVMAAPLRALCPHVRTAPHCLHAPGVSPGMHQDLLLGLCVFVLMPRYHAAAILIPLPWAALYVLK